MGTVARTIKAFSYGLIVSLHRNLDRKGSTSTGLDFRNADMVHRILVASYTDAVYTLLFDPSKPIDAALSLLSILKVGHHPSWLERHLFDPTIVFTGLEQTDGRLIAMKYDLNNGEGQVLANVSSGGADPCSILVTESNILVGNYSSGSVGIYALPSSQDPVSLKEAQPALQFHGSGPCVERQLSSHPHQVYAARQPSGEVLAPDLGSDRVWRLAKNAEGLWEKKGEVTFDKHPGGGPRHVIVHDSKLYTLLELNNKIIVHHFQSICAKPSLVATGVLPVPQGIKPLTMLAAEMLCPAPNANFPSALLYVSNRNHPRPHGDIISIFSTLRDGESELKRVGDVPTGLAHVRGFAFFGPDDRYVIVGGANGGGVKVFERTDSGRGMREVAHLPASDGGVGLSPTAFLCL